MYPHLESFASKLYYDFVALESKGYDFIMVEKIKEKGLGFALLNRAFKGIRRGILKMEGLPHFLSSQPFLIKEQKLKFSLYL